MATVNLVITASSVATFNFDYVEPTLNNDGSALTDLKEVIVDFKVGAAAYELLTVVAASSPNGGGAQSKSIPNKSIGFTATTATVKFTAVDLNGNKSQIVEVVVPIDRIPPAAIS